MSGKRLGVLSGLVVALVLMIGVVQAGAQGSTQVLKFYDTAGTETGVGFDLNNQNAVPPVGGSIVIALRLKNIGSQFGKPSGATVGRVLLDCTVLAVDASAPYIDGVCSGIAHVPNGFFTFGGNGGLVNAKVTHYDITGGDGPYANDRGQIVVVSAANGSSDATVTLSS